MILDRGRPVRFGVVLVGDVTETWAERCRRVEALGYDVLSVADHLGRPGPFSALGAAAAVTDRVRLGTFVLNAAFHDPVLLAREAVTLDVLSGGRLELGLGSGYVRSEFDALGLPFDTPGDRLDGLDRLLDRLEPLLAEPEVGPRPVQQPIPILLGGNGDRMLRTAARRARIVGFSGSTTDSDGHRTLVGARDYLERIEYARAAAGDRAAEIEWNAVVQVVEVTEDREGAAEAARRARAPHLTPEDFLASPAVLIGTVDEMAAELDHRRRELGVGYVTVLEPAMESFAPVIARLRG